ncbi:MAG: sigma-70 family RNA polymerase sigma factor [Verrucomicrobiota bacterium]
METQFEDEPIDPGQFPMTRWSLVLGAQEGSEDVRSRALSELCEVYWYPLYAYLRRRGLNESDAEDATQGFFCELLEKDRVQLFSESKGKLRAYLLSSIKNYLRDQGKRERALKRGGGEAPLSLDLASAEERYAYEPPEFETPEKLFELRWALTLMERAFEKVEEEYRRLDKLETYEALKGHLSGDGEVSFREVGERVGMTEGAARVTLHRMRKLYQKYLKEEIAETVSDEESVDEELRHLTQVFAQ